MVLKDLYFTAKSLEREWFFSENQKNKDQINFLIFHREKNIKYSRNFKGIIENAQKKESGNRRV